MIAAIRSLQFAFITCISAVFVLAAASAAFADGVPGSPTDQAAKFRQLGQDIPTPNLYRSASGAPGPAYWQQRADYKIDVEIDEDNKELIASEVITYTNNSPDTLNYLWVQLDQNRFRNDSVARMSETASTAGSRRASSGKGDSLSFNALARNQALHDTPHGNRITAVLDERGRKLPYVINGTMMRVDLPAPLGPNDVTTFQIDWRQFIINEPIIGGRGGYEHFPENDTYIYFLAQWFPRMAAYTDYEGWANKQFLGRGEFTLEFGDYEVNITVPADHIVSSTGVLQNPREVMSAEQRRRLEKANDKDLTFIVTAEEALENEKESTNRKKTWRYTAKNVRDFAFSSSRKFIWDAMIHKQDDPDVPEVLAMSFYPNEAEPIWSQYSTHAVIHTMDVYSRFSFAYPYPTAQSVNTWERGGMEYPMITFNGYRPTKDEKSGKITYSRSIKHALIGVIIHEIGHIYFPMIVNSDERQWTWMDEGINTFLEYLAEYEWEDKFSILGGEANPLDVITSYMKSKNQVPIMTQSDSILQFGPNAYSKPASALVVLRETVMGRELFDFAFKQYAMRWKFKRPTPSDFFRTMEDASGVDLDWFWRGWFYSTDHVDVAITGLREYKISSQDPDEEFVLNRSEFHRDHPDNITMLRNREEGIVPYTQRVDGLTDLYDENDKFTVTNKDRNSYKKFLKGLKDWERAAYERALKDDQFIYFADFKNIGGLVTPLPVTLNYADGSSEDIMIPAEIWRRSPDKVTKLFMLDKALSSIDLDNAHQTADADFSNNSFPPKVHKSRLELYKSNRKRRNLMADMLVELEAEDKASAGGDGKAVPMEQGSGAGKPASESSGPAPTKPAEAEQMQMGDQPTPKKDEKKKKDDMPEKTFLQRLMDMNRD